MKNSIFMKFRLFILPVFSLLVSCGNEKKQANDDALSFSGDNGRDSYELVTIRRPVSVEEYFKMWSIPYKICAANAKLQNVPVKPFPAIPADFVMKRTTITSDGKSFRTTEEEFGVDIQDVEIENGCATSYGSGVRTWVSHNGIETELDSENQSNPSENATYRLKPYDPEIAQSYAIGKKINGVAVRCTGNDDLSIAGGMIAEMCVLDPILGKIAMPDGKPPIVYTRDVPGPSLFGSPIIEEPVSLKVGIKVNPQVFVSAEGK